MGIGSGLFFAFSGVFYRGATLSVGLESLMLQAGATLAMVGLIQIAMLSLYITAAERHTWGRVIGAWKTVLPLGLLSAGGSWCWFAAFALVNNAYVFAVGQIEVIFSLMASVLFFREKIADREALGIALLSASILGIILLN